jgi:hypothetical protein
VAVVLELAGDTHPIDVAGAIEDAIGGVSRVSADAADVRFRAALF